MSDTSMNYDTAVTRRHLFAAYVEHMVKYLTLKYPKAPLNEIQSFVRQVVKEQHEALTSRLHTAQRLGENINKPRPRDQMLLPTFHMIRQTDDRDKHTHSSGNLEEYSSEDILSVLGEYKNKVLCQYGTIYETADILSGFLKGMIGGLTTMRGDEKKLMKAANQRGDKVAVTYHNNNQSTIKVVANSTIGAAGSAGNFLSSIYNFTSVTSVARFFTMHAYSYTERFLASNFYFRTEEQLVDHLINCLLYGPSETVVLDTLQKYELHIPSSSEVYDFVCSCLHRYILPCDHPGVRDILDSLSPGMLGFIYYMGNFKHLVFNNSSYFRPWFTEAMTTSVPDEHVAYPSEIDINVLYKIDEDLITVLSIMYSSEFPLNAKGMPISIYDTVKEVPEVALKIVKKFYILEHMLRSVQELMDLFMDHEVTCGYISEHKNMYREVIVYSDTDSIAFTTKEWIEWMTGTLAVTPDSMNMNALMVYFVSKAMVGLMRHLSYHTGAVGDDVHAMTMKNEYYMLITILTALKKNYIQLLKVQEGVVYPNAKLDIKGVNLRGSMYGREVLAYTFWFIKSTIDDILTTGKVSARKKISEVLRFERMIFDSLRNQKTEFLTVTSVKSESDYKDADRSVYFNYKFWEDVFGDKYGNIQVPTKCYVLPLTNVRSSEYIEYIQEKYPDRVDKLKGFFDKYPVKDINLIPINPITNNIPEELQRVANYRKIIYVNSRPLYLFLSCLGINIGIPVKKNFSLFSDVYGLVNEVEGEVARKYI